MHCAVVDKMTKKSKGRRKNRKKWNVKINVLWLWLCLYCVARIDEEERIERKKQREEESKNSIEKKWYVCCNENQKQVRSGSRRASMCV